VLVLQALLKQDVQNLAAVEDLLGKTVRHGDCSY
jgi:hypothetical protein